jgi:ketosteroid isomerase-like protein
MKNSIILLGMLLIIASCQQNGALTPEDIADMDARRADFVTQMKAGDFTNIANIYANDCVVLAPGSEALVGIDASVNMMKEGGVPTEFTITNMETEGNGIYAIGRGSYTFGMQINDSTSVTDKGKYLEVWKKQEDGTWRLYRDIWNSNSGMGM